MGAGQNDGVPINLCLRTYPDYVLKENHAADWFEQQPLFSSYNSWRNSWRWAILEKKLN